MLPGPEPDARENVTVLESPASLEIDHVTLTTEGVSEKTMKELVVLFPPFVEDLTALTVPLLKPDPPPPPEPLTPPEPPTAPLPPSPPLLVPSPAVLETV